MKSSKVTLMCIVFCVCGIGAGWLIGWPGGFRRGKEFVYEQQFKTSEWNLKTAEENGQSDDLIEYIKMQGYHFSGKVPDSWLAYTVDHGPVDIDLIPDLRGGKGDSYPDSNYLHLKRRMEENPVKPGKKE